MLAQCQKGDTKAQMTLYNKYAQAMFIVSRNIIKDDMRAEEAMQDAFLSAFDKLDEFSGEVTFGAWLKKIVINKSLDYLKKDKIYSQTEDIENHNVEEEEVIELNIEERLNEVRQAVEKLPQNYRVIFSLYYLEGYDHEEIAEILDLSYANSRTMLNRAKAKLVSLVNEKNER